MKRIIIILLIIIHLGRHIWCRGWRRTYQSHSRTANRTNHTSFSLVISLLTFDLRKAQPQCRVHPVGLHKGTHFCYYFCSFLPCIFLSFQFSLALSLSFFCVRSFILSFFHSLFLSPQCRGTHGMSSHVSPPPTAPPPLLLSNT